jgi:hypothetical protein
MDDRIDSIDDSELLAKSSDLHVEKMKSLGMPALLARNKNGETVTIVKVHPAWNRTEAWRSIRWIYSDRPSVTQTIC